MNTAPASRPAFSHPRRRSFSVTLAKVTTGLTVVLLGSGCRSSPCSDKDATAPASVSDVAEGLPGSSVCSATGKDGAMLAVWGDAVELRKKTLALRVAMRARGWAEQPGTSFDGKPYEKFVKGEDMISVRFSPGKMASFGSKLDKEGAYVHVSHSAMQGSKRATP